MANLPVPYQSQLPRKYQKEVNGIVAVAQASYQAIGAVYTSEVTYVVGDLTYMDNEIRRAVKNGMPQSQAQSLVYEAVRYQHYMSEVTDGAASDIISRQRRY